MRSFKEKWGQMTTLRKITWVVFGIWVLSMPIARLMGSKLYPDIALNVYFVFLMFISVIQNHVTAGTSLGMKLLTDAGLIAVAALHTLSALEKAKVLVLPEGFFWLELVSAVAVIAFVLLLYIRQEQTKEKANNDL